MVNEENKKSWYKEFEAEENEFMRDYIENLITHKLETTDFEKLFFQNLPPSDDWQPRGELKKTNFVRPTLEDFEKTFDELDKEMKRFRKQEKERFLEMISHLTHLISNYMVEKVKSKGVPNALLFNPDCDEDARVMGEQIAQNYRIRLIGDMPILKGTQIQIFFIWDDELCFLPEYPLYKPYTIKKNPLHFPLKRFL